MLQAPFWTSRPALQSYMCTISHAESLCGVVPCNIQLFSSSFKGKFEESPDTRKDMCLCIAKLFCPNSMETEAFD